MITAPEQRRAAFRSHCTQCAKDVTGQFRPFCPDCGAMTDIAYDMRRVELRDSPNPYHRFIDLLPVRDVRLLPADARYTPIVHATNLGSLLGMSKLYLKNETVLPTSTTKDRMAAVSLAYLYECGVREFATSSTGNSSTAYAAAIGGVPELQMYLFTAASFRQRLALPDSDRIADVVLNDATFVDAGDAAAAFARMTGVASESGFFNPARREGLKLAWLEATEQVPGSIDWYVQAVSSAMGVYGVNKAAAELARLGIAAPAPRLLGVQQASCAPMVRAWVDGSDRIRPSDIVSRPSGIAPEILRGDPSRAYPHIRRIVKHSDGDLLSVSESEIRTARDLVDDLEGIRIGFAASAAVAGVARARKCGFIGAEQTVVVNLTGAERTPPSLPTKHTQWLERGDDGWDVGVVQRLRSVRPKAA